MPAGTLNVTIEQGATWEYAMTWSEYDAENSPTYAGDPIDLSIYSARAHIRRRKSATDYLLAMTTENGMITLGGALGTISFHVPAEDTAALSFATGVWDLELFYVSGEEEIVRRLIEGTVTLSKEVTK